MVSLTESGLYNIERKLRALGSDTELVSVLGSVCDRGLMVEACEDVDIVIHAAAHKHVPICESNPIAAIENNVRGTLCLTAAVEMAGVAQFVLISTDKAVRPASIMGATKRAAEMIVSHRAARSENTQFMTVRFGNVMDSAGSVIPLWREQIANGDAVLCIIEAGIKVGSTSDSPSFDVGDWPADVDITVRVAGRVQGHGGTGGIAAGSGSAALYTRYPVTLENNGEVYGGGGGGGFGATTVDGGGFPYTVYSGGGGGAGFPPGGSSLGGEPGTTEAGGAGATLAGAGGSPGADGQAGNGSAGGAAGAAIDGSSFVSLINTGSILGSQIN